MIGSTALPEDKTLKSETVKPVELKLFYMLLKEILYLSTNLEHAKDDTYLMVPYRK